MPNRTDRKAMIVRSIRGMTMALGVALAGLLIGGCAGSKVDVENVESKYPPVLRPIEYDTVYTKEAVDERPQLKGGLRGLLARVDYPTAAKRAGITGRVIVAFVVTPEGDTANIRVAQSVHPLLDDEARRVMERASFDPGRLNGEAVPVQLEMPVTFDQRSD
jgi:TonB family protein